MKKFLIFSLLILGTIGLMARPRNAGARRGHGGRGYRNQYHHPRYNHPRYRHPYYWRPYWENPFSYYYGPEIYDPQIDFGYNGPDADTF